MLDGTGADYRHARDRHHGAGFRVKWRVQLSRFRVGETITITPDGGSVSGPSTAPSVAAWVAYNATANVAFLAFGMGTR